jgi:hypothetical protein
MAFVANATLTLCFFQVPVASLPLYLPVAVTPTLPLSKLLQEFHGSGSHMAFVAKDPILLNHSLAALARLRSASHARAAHVPFEPDAAAAASPHAVAQEQSNALAALRHCSILGLVTLEDVIEVLLAQAIYDETDRSEARRTLGKFLRGVALPVLKGRVSAAKQSDTSWHSALERTVSGDARGRSASAAPTGSQAETSTVSSVTTGTEGGRPRGSEAPTPLISDWLRGSDNGGNGDDGGNGVDSSNRRASGGFSERNQRNSSRTFARGLFSTSTRAAQAGGRGRPPSSGSTTEPLLSASSHASSRPGKYASLANPEEGP